ncbi:MAG: K+ channel TrkA-N [Robiginitomaculum sp.]|nr:MAG: K+ channel TrkA-N [Robiginitomaculum sp.]
MLAQNLILASVMVAFTALIHLMGLTFLIWIMRNSKASELAKFSVLRSSTVIMLVVMGIFAIHTIEVWAYAALYYKLELFDTFEACLYFSTSVFTTVGFGDLVVGPHWRLLTAIESANGFLLLGWSTAFLISLTGHMRALEHKWLEGGDSGENQG